MYFDFTCTKVIQVAQSTIFTPSYFIKKNIKDAKFSVSGRLLKNEGKWGRGGGGGGQQKETL